MDANQKAIDMYNQMTQMGSYYDSGRPVAVDPRIILDDVLARLPVTKSDVILDVGCGTGVITIPLSKHCKFIHALDAGEKVIEKAKAICQREHITNIAYYLGSALALPFEENFFDHVLMYAVMQLLDNEEQVKQCVAQLVRVCKPGGRILIAEVPDQGARLEFEKRAKTPQEESILEQFKIRRAEYDRLFKEHVHALPIANSVALDCQRIVQEAKRLGCEGQILLQDIRQPFSLTRRDVLLTKRSG